MARNSTRSGYRVMTKPNRREGPNSMLDRKSTRLNSSHSQISYAVFCLKKKKKKNIQQQSKQSSKKYPYYEQTTSHLHQITEVYTTLNSPHSPVRTRDHCTLHQHCRYIY